MSKITTGCIRLRGVRQNNLKNIDLDVPLGQLVVISGLSGSGKSSLAFETLFAEGQRRYIETFSPYARQFLDRMDKPQARSIEGIPPAIAIEQRNSVKSTRSTVGTMTEITDYAKLFWGHLARLHCRGCGKLVTRETPQKVWENLRARAAEAETLVTFQLELSDKFSLEESLALVARQGFQRLLLDGQITALDQSLARLKASPPTRLTVVQDRVKLKESNRARFAEACEQAYHFGKGKLAVHLLAQSSTVGRAVPCPPGEARVTLVSPPSPDGGQGTARPTFPSAPKTDSLPDHPLDRDSGGGIRETFPFSSGLHCAVCDLDYREPSPALFSFNHPTGACPKCRGFGRVITIDYNAAIPDRAKTLAGGVVKPWQTKTGAECQADMQKFAKLRQVPLNVPFRDLSKKFQDWVIDGDPGYGADKAHEWPRAWYGVKGYFRWLESKAYKMHVRVLLARYRRYETCPDCHGTRFQPETLLYTIPAPGGGKEMALPDFYRLNVQQALEFVNSLLAGRQRAKVSDPLALALEEVRSRLGFLDDSGLGYLSLDRMTRSLSGGETERVNLTACLGSRLVNTLFVLDEPSVGLHPRDTARLVRIVRQLRDAGNTVVLVEHEAAVMRAADQIIDLGPGHGESGGEVVFQGTCEEILRSPNSLTGQYLSGKKQIAPPPRRPVSLSKQPMIAGRAKRQSLAVGRVVLCPPGEAAVTSVPLPFPDGGQRSARPTLRLPPVGDALQGGAALVIRNANLHNLKNLTVQIPLGRFVCVTGVSGSGKSTLVREVLLPALQERLAANPPAQPTKGDEESPDTKSSSDPNPNLNLNPNPNPNPEDDPPDSKPPPANTTVLEGWEHLARVAAVDQSLLGRTPRSNPAVYIGAFDDIRALFAQTPAASQRGLSASAFSFNSAQGQCERCRGAGFEKIEMQFLSDIFVRCPDCDGRRYRPHILEVKAAPVAQPSRLRVPAASRRRAKPTPPAARALNIAELLESTVDDAIQFLNHFADSRPAQRAAASLQLLQEVGLGYIRLGQPINTLSGGESQRLKLVSHLALQSSAAFLGARSSRPLPSASRRRNLPTKTDPAAEKPTLFIFDEPTTGLHFDDVRVLLKVFQRLATAGHSVLAIEHNLDVIKSADWLIDLGPEGGEEGGQIVVEGTPEQVAATPESHTGTALAAVLTQPR
jgi:excinuclease ABC subunit A